MCSQIDAEPGPPLKTKIRRAGVAVGRIQLIGGVEDLRGDLAFFVFERQHAHCGVIGELSAGQRDCVRGGDGRLLGDYGFVVFCGVGHGYRSLELPIG